MKKNILWNRIMFPVLALVSIVSCEKEGMNDTGSESLVTHETAAAEKNLDNDLAKAVRNATAKYHSTTLAVAAGYEPDDHCVAVPALGGMGYHWANPGLVDPEFNPLEPEVMLYATGPGGNLRLVAVEYIVINVGQPRPMFGTQPFDIGGTPVPVAHWSLHAWVHETNPSGMFIPFNPNISCP